jgi:hypothetical protein
MKFYKAKMLGEIGRVHIVELEEDVLLSDSAAESA